MKVSPFFKNRYVLYITVILGVTNLLGYIGMCLGISCDYLWSMFMKDPSPYRVQNRKMLKTCFRGWLQEMV